MDKIQSKTPDYRRILMQIDDSRAVKYKVPNKQDRRKGVS
jgi:hypothetical protein